MGLTLLTLLSANYDRYGLANGRDLAATLALIVRRGAQTTRRVMYLAVLLSGPRTVLLNGYM